jgi:hypothetical protein
MNDKISNCFEALDSEELFEKHIANFHPSHKQVLKYFKFWHLPPHLQVVSRSFCVLAFNRVVDGGDGIEITIGLRKLLEAKDAFVRAKV